MSSTTKLSQISHRLAASGIRVWAIVPAAGQGSRMKQAIPKQYLEYRGQPMIQHVLTSLLACSLIEHVWVAVARGDSHWQELPISRHNKCSVIEGGQTRMDSVRQGLLALDTVANEQDWVLTQDAARPNLDETLITELLAQCIDHPVGGVTAIPVADTLKKVNDCGHITETVDRDQYALAQTPQLFRYGLLLRAFTQAKDSLLTDESMGIEQLGLQPKMVLGRRCNHKITWPEDLS